MQPNTIFQVATLDSIIAGNYDGYYHIKDLPKEANLGLGTFENLDGEMTLIDGKYYQLKADGKAYVPDENVGTPFTSVANFKPTKEFQLPKTMSMKEFTAYLDKEMPEANVPLLVRFDGDFDMVHFRSVPAQKRPFPSLAEVAKQQPEFKKEHVKGSLVAFRFSKYMSAFNFPGFHLHFIDDGRKFGGHVLGFSITKGRIQVAESGDFRLRLPMNADSFRKTDFTIDRSKETAAVEGGSE